MAVKERCKQMEGKIGIQLRDIEVKVCTGGEGGGLVSTTCVQLKGDGDQIFALAWV